MMQTLSTRTVCCKLSLDADAATAIRATAEAFNAAATYCASVAWSERITNKNKLHHTSWKIGGAELVQRGGQFFLHITQTKANPAPGEPTGFLGVDLGLVNLAADSDGETYSGASVQRVRKRRFQHRQRLQTASTRRARWRLRQLARTEARFQRDVNHCISKQVVKKACTARKALAIEELTKIRERVTVRRAQRRARHSWAFRQLRSFLTYKAQQAGILVVAVDPRNTSRTCAVCGHCEKANRLDQAHFRCLRCGHIAAADTNAAVIIACRAARQTAYCAAPPSGGGASTSPPALAVGI